MATHFARPRADGRRACPVSYTSLPIPHLEQPFTSDSAAPFTVSFFGEQTVQTKQMCFGAQPRYAFDSWPGESGGTPSAARPC